MVPVSVALLLVSGTEMLRSKSLTPHLPTPAITTTRSTGTMHDNGFGHGLPVKSKDGAAWDHMRPLLENPDLKPSFRSRSTPPEMTSARARLFTLGSAGSGRFQGGLPELG